MTDDVECSAKYAAHLHADHISAQKKCPCLFTRTRAQVTPTAYACAHSELCILDVTSLLFNTMFYDKYDAKNHVPVFEYVLHTTSFVNVFITLYVVCVLKRLGCTISATEFVHIGAMIWHYDRFYHGILSIAQCMCFWEPCRCHEKKKMWTV